MVKVTVFLLIVASQPAFATGHFIPFAQECLQQKDDQACLATYATTPPHTLKAEELKHLRNAADRACSKNDPLGCLIKKCVAKQDCLSDRSLSGLKPLCLGSSSPIACFIYGSLWDTKRKSLGNGKYRILPHEADTLFDIYMKGCESNSRWQCLIASSFNLYGLSADRQNKITSTLCKLGNPNACSMTARTQQCVSPMSQGIGSWTKIPISSRFPVRMYGTSLIPTTHHVDVIYKAHFDQEAFFTGVISIPLINGKVETAITKWPKDTYVVSHSTYGTSPFALKMKNDSKGSYPDGSEFDFDRHRWVRDPTPRDTNDCSRNARITGKCCAHFDKYLAFTAASLHYCMSARELRVANPLLGEYRLPGNSSWTPIRVTPKNPWLNFKSVAFLGDEFFFWGTEKFGPPGEPNQGNGTDNKLRSFNTKTNLWTELPHSGDFCPSTSGLVSGQRDGFLVDEASGKLFTLGVQCSQATQFPIAGIFDTHTKTWKTVPLPRSGQIKQVTPMGSHYLITTRTPQNTQIFGTLDTGMAQWENFTSPSNFFNQSHEDLYYTTWTGTELLAISKAGAVAFNPTTKTFRALNIDPNIPVCPGGASAFTGKQMLIWAPETLASEYALSTDLLVFEP